MRWSFVFLIVVLLTAIAGAITVNVTGDAITGKPLQYFGMNLTIVASPVVSLLAPKNGTYFVNTSIPLNYSITNGAETIWYSLDSGSNATITSSIFFNASEGAHELFLYANNSVGEGSASVSFSVDSTVFRIIYDKWTGANKGSSTNFSILTYEEVQNLSGIILEHTSYGKILFNQNINMTDDDNFSDRQLDLNSTVFISSNSIRLNSALLPNFNKSATLWLYGLTFSDPRILVNGAECPSSICKEESYTGGVLKFNVTSFPGNFSVDETPTIPPVTPPGGGGGGGGLFRYIFPKATSFSTDVDEIKISTTPGKVITKTVRVTNNLNQGISISISSKNLDDFVVLKENKLILGAKESKSFSMDFVVRDDTLVNLYLGKIILTNDNNHEQTELLTVIEVVSEGALLDVTVDIQPEYKFVSPGSDVLAKIALFNVKADSLRRDIVVDYIIENADREQILTDRETVSVETQTSWIRRFTIPKGTSNGKYVLYVKTTTFEGKIASATDTFEVVSTKTEIMYIFLIFLVIIILAVVVYFTVKRKAEEGIKKIDIRNIIRKK